MMGIFKKEKKREKPSVASSDERSLGSTIENDLIGVSDWKSSKLSFITGFGALKRVATGFMNSFAATGSRLSALSVVVLPDKDKTKSLQLEYMKEDARTKFTESMKLHNVSEIDLTRIIRNTYSNGYFFLFIAAMCFGFFLFSIYFWPPEYKVGYLFRLGPFPLALAFTIKHFYTNWMIRNRGFYPITSFIKSFDWLPVKYRND